MKKLLLLALVLGVAGCSSSSSSNAYTIGTAIVSWNTNGAAVYWVITQTPGDQGSAAVTVGVSVNCWPAGVVPLTLCATGGVGVPMVRSIVAGALTSDAASVTV